MSEIKTRPEAEKEARSILAALVTMPKDAEERNSYLASLQKLNKEFDLGLSGEIQKLEGTEESVTVDPSTETEELVLSRDVPNKNKKNEGDDDNMAGSKTDYVVKAKNFLNTHLFGGVKVSHLVALLLGAILVFAFLPSGEDTSTLDKQITDLTKENTRLQAGWTKANETGSAGGVPCEFNASTQEAAVNAATKKIQEKLDECQNKSGVAAEIGSFTDEETKDWIDGKLSLQKTAVNTFVPFETKDEALEFVKEVYTYNSAHNLAWNNKEANYAIADAHKSDRDEVKMLFSAKNNDLFAVVPSESNVVIPTIYKFVEEDNDYALEEYDGSDVAVAAMDKLKKSSSANND